MTATDADLPPQTLTYSLGGGADAALFTIDGSTGVLAFTTSPDFEAPADANGDNVYEVIVQVSDGSLVATREFFPGGLAAAVRSAKKAPKLPPITPTRSASIAG